ncbi:MAG: protein-L-isoaspartate(D-aspartate) O-methyltransferase [Acidimicrobiales bacterium]|jgi:protein-L-isoaspartate(D-aspartate) O-methyltransferase|nr:protein-L-isoaspartate(D-aspartate) O-methyltransferase [Acidimicrobiales bacterium]|tara:strand:- start:6784 stop:7413 length:630 start_codon:yes stop_codon:yes gene_type:complete
MVDDHLAARDIQDPRVLAAMEAVPRHRFLPADLVYAAYEDRPLPIGYGQTISQPYIVAFTAQALSLQADDRLLEVGTGSGYAAAVFAELCAEVVSVECVPFLARMARQRLGQLGYEDVVVVEGDGGLGWIQSAPYDAIALAAAAPQVPSQLLEQLAPDGRMVLPLGGKNQNQKLIRLVSAGKEINEEELLPVSFVPLVGYAGQVPPEVL